METLTATEIIEKFGFSYLRELATFGALSDKVIECLLTGGVITRLKKGEYITRREEEATDFQVVLQGKMAFYKHGDDHDVLTRYFSKGEQSGFDLMLGLIPHDGTDVAMEDSLILSISKAQFHGLHTQHPASFGLLMINLARELSREIAMLEEVIEDSTGWDSYGETPDVLLPPC